MFEIKETEAFVRSFQKLPDELKERFVRQLRKVKENPFGLGKTLRYTWLRELKQGKFRLYYLIYESEVIILLVEVSEKKEQQASIEGILKNREIFKEAVLKGKDYKY